MNKTQRALHVVTKNRLYQHFKTAATTLTKNELQTILDNIELDFKSLGTTKKSEKMQAYWAGQRELTTFKLTCRDSGLEQYFDTCEAAAEALALKPQSLRVALSRSKGVYSKQIDEQLYTLTRLTQCSETNNMTSG